MGSRLHLAPRPEHIPGPSAASIMEVRQGAIPSVDAPASVASMAAVADFTEAVDSTVGADLTEVGVGGNWLG